MISSCILQKEATNVQYALEDEGMPTYLDPQWFTLYEAREKIKQSHPDIDFRDPGMIAGIMVSAVQPLTRTLAESFVSAPETGNAYGSIECG